MVIFKTIVIGFILVFAYTRGVKIQKLYFEDEKYINENFNFFDFSNKNDNKSMILKRLRKQFILFVMSVFLFVSILYL